MACLIFSHCYNLRSGRTGGGSQELRLPLVISNTEENWKTGAAQRTEMENGTRAQVDNRITDLVPTVTGFSTNLQGDRPYGYDMKGSSKPHNVSDTCGGAFRRKGEKRVREGAEQEVGKG